MEYGLIDGFGDRNDREQDKVASYLISLECQLVRYSITVPMIGLC